jgi:hypothetical protein
MFFSYIYKHWLMKHVYLNKYDILHIDNNIKMSYSLNMHMCHGQLKEFIFTKTIFHYNV